MLCYRSSLSRALERWNEATVEVVIILCDLTNQIIESPNYIKVQVCMLESKKRKEDTMVL